MHYRYSKMVSELPAPQLAAYMRAELERQRVNPRRLDVAANDSERQRVLASIPMPPELTIDDESAAG